MSPELDSVFENLQSIINKKYGKDSNLLIKLNDQSMVLPEEDLIRTGSIALDFALGIGGFQRGRIVEVQGGESSGKTTICLHAVANVQKMGGNCLYIDSEHATDPKYAKALGVDFDKLYFSQPDYGEQALDILDMSIKTGKIALAVIDSVAALVPKAELEGEMEDVQIGLQARMMSKVMRKITAVASHTNTAVIFINQTRASIGMGMGNVGTGGNALKFYASQRLKISRLGSTTSGSKFDSKGNKTQVQVIKNKLAPPFKVAEFPITFGIGIDRLEEIVALAASDGIIKKGGAWFTYEEQKFQGTENMRMFLQENPEIADKIERELRENRGLI